MSKHWWAVLVLALGGGLACRSTAPETGPVEVGEGTSLLGTPLVRPEIEPARAARLEADLALAVARRDAAPDDPDAWVWIGRRLGYLGRFREAVGVYDTAIVRFPKDAALLRHRGHRRITLRDFAGAIVDLERAWELARDTADVIEPDGAPTAGVPPRSSLKRNVLYHLGLAHYLKGDFDTSAEVFTRAVDLGGNDDAIVAANWWRCLSLERIGDRSKVDAALALIRSPDEAGGMDVRENTSYWNLQLVWAGKRPESSLIPKDGPLGLSVDQATIGYGLARFSRMRGEQAEGTRRLWAVVNKTSWASFGHIAAEADIARENCTTSDAAR